MNQVDSGRVSSTAALSLPCVICHESSQLTAHSSQILQVHYQHCSFHSRHLHMASLEHAIHGQRVA